MTIRKLAFGGAVALASLLGTSSAFAFTHHPATAAEVKATDDLNAQALANARGQAGMNTNTAMPAGGATANDTMSAPGASMTTDTGVNAAPNATKPNGATDTTAPPPATDPPAPAPGQ